ncbi:hypothetical protein JYU34_011762 [Plutella xylostella]|uniref:Peroxisome assembly protein 12 n=1 Tax=Plutella xylostella TaxID=51655 RepID=A0ABQ7QDK6_PLUXY|nr:hypothetical protein JYU34_011762 [Plutella xylostella]
MAVYAAHLTRTLQGTPSVFQVTAQEALGSTVKPALRKVVEYLAAAYPDKCGWSERWYDELYLALDACLQYHYLKHYAASFSESFYGLIRTPTSSQLEFSSGTRLPPSLERSSLLLLTLAPYLWDKAGDIVQRWRERNEDGLLGKSKSDTLRRAAVKVYSIAHLVFELSRLAQMCLYMSGRSVSATLALRWLGLRLRDAPTQREDSGDLSSMAELLSFPTIGALLLRGAEYGAFLVQFLRWWESRGARGGGALPVPDPPERDERCSRYLNRCPVCLQAWRIPTVLPVSGYIFCYMCISRHVRQAGECPVTHLPAAEDSLVRLYLQ